MNGFGHGRIKRVYRGLGIGIIEPETAGPDIVFSDNVVRGGERGFQNLGEGDRVIYRPYPERIGDQPFADDIWLA